MKKVFIKIGCLILLGMVGCSTLKVNVSPRHQNSVSSSYNTFAVFPLADYSFYQCFLREDCLWYISKNKKITEEVIDNLSSYGLKPVVYEDVVSLLKKEKIIKPMKLSLEEYFKMSLDIKSGPGTLEYELKLPYIEEMKDEIRKLISQKMRLQNKKKLLAQKVELEESVEGLSKEKIIEIGKALGADLIIRGAIIEYGIRERKTLNPLHSGILLPFIDVVNNLVFGVSFSDKYSEGLTDLSTGAGLGYLVGHQSGFGAQGAGIGAGTVFLSLVRNKKLESSVVQVRLYAQDARTAQVIWTGRAEVEYTPINPFDSNVHHYKTMFDKTIKKAVKLLIKDLISKIKQS